MMDPRWTRGILQVMQRQLGLLQVQSDGPKILGVISFTEDGSCAGHTNGQEYGQGVWPGERCRCMYMYVYSYAYAYAYVHASICIP